MLFLVLSFISGVLVGSQFSLANKIYLNARPNLSRTAGLLYSCDLLGGWLGEVIGGVIFLPLLGLFGSGMVVVLLKLISFGIIVTAKP